VTVECGVGFDLTLQRQGALDAVLDLSPCST
jgi:hypothetical protein